MTSQSAWVTRGTIVIVTGQDIFEGGGYNVHASPYNGVGSVEQAVAGLVVFGWRDKGRRQQSKAQRNLNKDGGQPGLERPLEIRLLDPQPDEAQRDKQAQHLGRVLLQVEDECVRRLGWREGDDEEARDEVDGKTANRRAKWLGGRESF